MNILLPTEFALLDKKYANGLNSYTQTNCQVSLTDNGYRIYRPPNIVYDSSDSTTQTMWGGLKIQPFKISDDILLQGHTYIILFDVNGQSFCKPSIYWSNNMGWGGGGLIPNPSNISNNNLPTNFNGSLRIHYKFTINDSIRKVCTKSYSSFVEGTEYISYRDFCFNFGYQNTGELGTDIYITNIQMYDLTEENRLDINKYGVISSLTFDELPPPQDSQTSVRFGENYILSKEFIEI